MARPDPPAPRGLGLERDRTDHRRQPRTGFVGDPATGLYYHPVVVDGVRVDDDLARTETFGPIVGVASFDTFDEAMELANSHGYGLSSSIYTNDPLNVFRFRDRISAGMVSVNNSTSGAEAHLPFGGNGRSGNGSRQSGLWVLDQFTRWQAMNWDYSGHLQMAQMDTADLEAISRTASRTPDARGLTGFLRRTTLRRFVGRGGSVHARRSFLVAFAFVAASACGGEGPDFGTVQVASGSPIVIGVSTMLEGDLASTGQALMDAATLAGEDVTIAGHEIEFVGVNDGCSEEGGATAAEELVDTEGLVGVVGGSCSDAVSGGQPVYEEAGITHISQLSTNVAMTDPEDRDPYRTFLRTAFNDAIQGAEQAAFAEDTLGAESAFIVHEGFRYGGAGVIFRESFTGELLDDVGFEDESSSPTSPRRSSRPIPTSCTSRASIRPASRSSRRSAGPATPARSSGATACTTRK